MSRRRRRRREDTYLEKVVADGPLLFSCGLDWMIGFIH
jgi:hypothetical protein